MKGKRVPRLQREDLKDQAEHTEQEARMVLPGIQALFGFQFVAVFNQRFMDLQPFNQILHWVALAMTALATIFMMAPAAFHRQAEPHFISRRFVNLASRWLLFALVPLMISFTLDFYVIGLLITGSEIISVIVSLFVFAAFLTMWFIYPRSQTKNA